MYKIKHEPYGYRLTFGGFIPLEEMSQWVEDSKKELANAPREFVVFVDMRTLKPVEPETQECIRNGQILYKEKGMLRSVVIVATPIVKLQFIRIAKGSGIYEWERYLDVLTEPNWEEVGLNWILNSVDPDK